MLRVAPTLRRRSSSGPAGRPRWSHADIGHTLRQFGLPGFPLPKCHRHEGCHSPRPRRGQGRRRRRAEFSPRPCHRRHPQPERRGRRASARLLTPQGKIIADFIVAEARRRRTAAGFFLDVPRARWPPRWWKSSISTSCAPRFDRGFVRNPRRARGLGRTQTAPRTFGAKELGLCYADPRLPALGLRVMLPPHLAASGSRQTRRDTRRCRANMRRTVSRSACRAAASISPTATPFRTRPTWISSPASISPKAAMSARRSSRAWSTAAPHAPAPCRCAIDGAAPQAGAAIVAGDRQLGPWARPPPGRAIALLRLDRVAEALVARRGADRGRRADPSRQAGLGAVFLSRRNKGRRMTAPLSR